MEDENDYIEISKGTLKNLDLFYDIIISYYHKHIKESIFSFKEEIMIDNKKSIFYLEVQLPFFYLKNWWLFWKKNKIPSIKSKFYK